MSAWSDSLCALLNRACQQTFGEPVLYQPESADSLTVTGMITRASEEEQQQDGVYLHLLLSVSDFNAPPARGDRATIQDVEYIVWQTLMDQAGGYNLALRKV
jgi:hypothetical protein